MTIQPHTRLTRQEAIEHTRYASTGRAVTNFWTDLQRQNIQIHQAASGGWYVIARDLDAFDVLKVGAVDYCECCHRHTAHVNESTDAAIIWRCTVCQLVTEADKATLWGGGKLCYLPRDIRGGVWETAQLPLDTIVSSGVD